MEFLKKYSPLFLGLLIFVATAFFACTKDPCLGVSCLNGGACLDGNCICPLGYEAVNCSVQTRLQFVGEFTGDGVDQHNVNYHEWHFNFVAAGDSALKMNLIIQDSLRSSTTNLSFHIQHDLRSFTIDSAIIAGVYYRGSGTLGTAVASAEFTAIRISPPDTINYRFDNLIK
jgi:hypothetical protein